MASEGRIGDVQALGGRGEARGGDDLPLPQGDGTRGAAVARVKEKAGECGLDRGVEDDGLLHRPRAELEIGDRLERRPI